MNAIRLVKSILLGLALCVLLTAFTSLFALKLNKFLIKIFPFAIASIGSFMCSKYFVHNLKRHRLLYGIVASLVMSLLFTLISVLMWKGFPTKNSLIRMGAMLVSGVIASIEITPKSRMKRIKLKKQRNNERLI